MQIANTKKAMVVLPLPERRTSCFMGVLPWSELTSAIALTCGWQGILRTRFTDPTIELAKHGWNDIRNLGGCQCERFCNTVAQSSQRLNSRSESAFCSAGIKTMATLSE